MKPVDMVHLNHGQPGAINGDCMRACIASILELGVEEVPHFLATDNPHWLLDLTDWLAPRGLAWLCLRYSARPLNDETLRMEPIVIAGGQSPRGAWGHCVVGQLTMDGFRLLHDPHPSRAGIVGDPEDFVVLFRLDRASEATPSLRGAKGWRCFHCDEYFTDEASARDHFGHHQFQDPACTIDIAQFRRMEEHAERHAREDTELHRALQALESDKAIAVRRAEEEGYAKGLRDGQGIITDLEAAARQLSKVQRELHELRHAVWHVLDDAEERDDGAVIDLDHHATLCRLVPEDFNHLPPAEPSFASLGGKTAAAVDGPTP